VVFGCKGNIGIETNFVPIKCVSSPIQCTTTCLAQKGVKRFLQSEVFVLRNLFTNSLLGDGIHQPAVDFAIEKLDRGEWVHIFPEGKIFQDGKIRRFKWGIARMLLETQADPIIVPMYHRGLETILPEGKIYIPRPFGKKYVVAVGQPFSMKEYIKKLKEENADALTVFQIFDAGLNFHLQVSSKSNRISPGGDGKISK
jgi:hypothetical protein